MRAVPTFIANLTRVVLAAELSTRRNFGGAHPTDLFQVAHNLMHSQGSGYQRQEVDDCVVIAETVWHSWIKPHVKQMLVQDWGASEADADKVVEKYFRDDSPQYHPELKRGPRG